MLRKASHFYDGDRHALLHFCSVCDSLHYILIGNMYRGSMSLKSLCLSSEHATDVLTLTWPSI